MERILKKMCIVFLVCIVGVAAIFLIMNYQSKESNNKKEENQQEEISQDKETTKEEPKKDLEEEKNQKSEEENMTEEKTNSSMIETNNKIHNNYIPVAKFNVKIETNRLYIGDTTHLTTTIFPSNATDQEISYQSSNKNIAIVSKTGIVTAVNVGECYITISVKNAGNGQIKVKVLSKNNTVYNNDTNYNNNIQNSAEGNVEYNISIDNNHQSIIIDEPYKENDSSSNNQDDNKIPNVNQNKTSSSSDYSSDVKKENTQTSSTDSPKKEGSKKNGWYTKNNKKYYYKDNRLVKDTYVDYIYLDSNGIAKEKVGNFSATLYGATAWANQNINIREKASQNSSKIGKIPTGGKMKILSSDNTNTKYIKVKYNNKTGYVYSDYIYINLPDVMPDIIYSISNANKSIYKTSGKSIPNVTGSNLYGFTKKYNEKIGKTTYYVPLLYPVAKQLQKAYNQAVKQGYNLKIYDSYRPYDVSQKISKEFKQLYNSNSKVKKAVDYDKEGKYWGPGWFLANSVSSHNKGIAIDLTLTDQKGNELIAQTPMHTLDTRSTRKYNNSTANKLSNIMTSSGFETLDSEWWHFQENNYKSSVANSFRIK